MKQEKNQDKIKATNLELKEETIAIKRVTKVVEGGMNFRFTAIIVIGNGAGVVGYGIGKAKDVPKAIQKGIESARKKLIEISLRGDTTWYKTLGKFKSSQVVLKPAAPGTGVVAGGATRVIAKLAGIKNLLAKSKGSSNPHNLVKATFDALTRMEDGYKVAKRRGITINKVFNG